MLLAKRLTEQTGTPTVAQFPLVMLMVLQVVELQCLLCVNLNAEALVMVYSHLAAAAVRV